MTTLSKPIQNTREKPGWWQRRSAHQHMWHAFVYLILIAVALVLLLPFYWLVASSLKYESQLYQFPPEWIPNPVTLDNYTIALSDRMVEGVGGQTLQFFSFSRFVLNTLTIITANIFFGVSISALVAYALARLRFRGRELVFYTVIGALLMPSVVFMIPRFVIFANLDLDGSWWPLIIPAFFGYAGQIFFLRQYFLTISPELEDAAYVDGCSTLRFWWQIIIPLSKSALAVQVILTFLYHWNDFLEPLIYIGGNNQIWTVQLSLIQILARGQAVLFAYSAVLVIPCLLVFFLFQRTLIQGIVFTGVKA